jgi:MFS family permease
MQTVAVGALVISDTGQATWAVLVAAGAFLPIGVLSPVGGALADRLPRRPVLVIGNLAAALTAVLLAVLVAAGHDSPLALVLLVTLQGSASALIGPFQQAILPDLVPQSEFLAAISLNSAQFNLGRIVGPALAGATVAAFGYPVAFAANAVSFLAVVVALAFVRLAPPSGRSGRLLASLWAGLRAARGEPSCWAAIATIAVVAFLASPFIALVPVMARHLTHGGARAVAQTTALLTTAQGAGAVAGALCLAPLAYRLGRGRLLGWSLVLLPLVLVGYSGSRRPWQGAVAIFIVGLVYIGVLSGLSTVVQLRAPEAFRGRILAFFLVALGVAYPIGSLVQGPIIDQIGIGWTTAGASALLSLVMAVVAVGRRGIARAITSESGEDPAGAGVLSPAERIRPAHHRAVSGHQDPGHDGQAPDQQGRGRAGVLPGPRGYGHHRNPPARARGPLDGPRADRRRGRGEGRPCGGGHRAGSRRGGLLFRLVPLAVTVPDRQPRHRGHRPQRAEARRARDQDHPSHNGREPGRLERQHAGGDADHVAEDQHAEKYAGQGLRRGDPRKRVVQGGGVERALQQPQADQARHDYAVGGPAGEQRDERVRVHDLHGPAGERVRDAEDQPGADAGQQRSLVTRAPPAGVDEAVGDDRDPSGDRPVGRRAE